MHLPSDFLTSFFKDVRFFTINRSCWKIVQCSGAFKAPRSEFWPQFRFFRVEKSKLPESDEISGNFLWNFMKFQEIDQISKVFFTFPTAFAERKITKSLRSDRFHFSNLRKSFPARGFPHFQFSKNEENHRGFPVSEKSIIPILKFDKSNAPQADAPYRRIFKFEKCQKWHQTLRCRLAVLSVDDFDFSKIVQWKAIHFQISEMFFGLSLIDFGSKINSS